MPLIRRNDVFTAGGATQTGIIMVSWAFPLPIYVDVKRQGGRGLKRLDAWDLRTVTVKSEGPLKALEDSIGSNVAVTLTRGFIDEGTTGTGAAAVVSLSASGTQTYTGVGKVEVPRDTEGSDVDSPTTDREYEYTIHLQVSRRTVTESVGTTWSMDINTNEYTWNGRTNTLGMVVST